MTIKITSYKFVIIIIYLYIIHVSSDKVTWDLNLDFRINLDPDPGVPDLSKNVVGAVPFWHQSFHQVSYKSAIDCMRDAKKSPKIPYSTTLREMQK